ncbi:MAG: 16S rRNA (cytosine(967)-C(5))-methyltransferase RsmB [Syntrophales bacterium]|nr:16S rRNA (cytosine(967)-C(5))-methyltransferase RsmB [Syntrophales bacterium]
MIKTPRGMSVEILNRVELKDAYAEPLLDAFLSAHYLPNIHDRRLLTELVYGTLRMKGHLDWLIGKYYRGDFPSLNSTVKNILRTALYQLIYTNRIPVFAVVDEAVKLAKLLHPGSEALVNALLRNYLRKKDKLISPRKEEDPLEHISVLHSHPEWLVKRWLKSFGVEGTIALCRANNEAPPVALRVNRLKVTREKAIDELKEEGIEARETVFSPDGLVITENAPSLRKADSFIKGHIQVQDEASQMITRLAAPRPGERILDTCAGAGVKATHLAELMENKGEILAIDINEKKLLALQKLAERLGIGIVETRVGDATAGMESSLYNSFDKIIVDAPCSGLGTLKRNPEIKWRLAPGDIKTFAELQGKILGSSALCLKEGGIIVYSVCTVMPEENEGVIETFLRHHGDFRPLPPPGSIDCRLIDERGFFRTSPDRHGTDGFFAAVMVRKG